MHATLFPYIPLDLSGNSLKAPEDVKDPDEPLGYIGGPLGDHTDCGGYLQVSLLKDAAAGVSKADITLSCTRCRFSTVFPRRVRTYRELSDYFREIIGWDDDD